MKLTPQEPWLVTATRRVRRMCIKNETRTFLTTHQGVQSVLRKILLRTRWTTHSDLATFNLEGYLRCIINRIIMGLLDEMMLRFIIRLRLGIAKPIEAHERKYVAGVIFALCLRSKSSLQYASLNMFRLTQCRNMKEILIPFTDAGSSPGTRRKTEEERRIPYDALLSTMPKRMLNTPISQDHCWGCNAESTTQKCGRCLMFRYCTPACQAADWKEHKKHCASFKAMFNKQQFMDNMDRLKLGDNIPNTWAELIIRAFSTPDDRYTLKGRRKSGSGVSRAQNTPK
jgi:hypothetical protein